MYEAGDKPPQATNARIGVNQQLRSQDYHPPARRSGSQQAEAPLWHRVDSWDSGKCRQLKEALDLFGRTNRIVEILKEKCKADPK
ncbi:MAG: hypothetical protein R2682_13535 [Pyrinomonadaceae bacterium]